MAAETGNAGSATFTDGATGITLDTQLFGWSFDIAPDVHDVTTYAVTGNARDRIQGLYVITGTIEGYLDDTTAVSLDNLDGTTVLTESTHGELVLKGNTASGGQVYTFDAMISNISVGVGIGELNKLTASFRSSGAIVVSAVI